MVFSLLLVAAVGGLAYLLFGGMEGLMMVAAVANGADLEAMGVDPTMASSIQTSMWLVMWVAMALGLLLAGAFWFTPPLVMVREVGPFKALGLSLKGVFKNLLPFLLYGIIWIPLTLVAMIPIGLGLLIIVPMAWASIYWSYVDIFPEES